MNRKQTAGGGAPTRSNPHRPYHAQKWTQITKYRRAMPREAYRSLRYYETCAVVDFSGFKSYKIITLSENSIHFINSGSITIERNDVIYLGDIRSIGCVNESSEIFGDSETNENSQMITIKITAGKICEIHTIEEKSKLMFHIHAAWRAYTDRKSLGLGIAISTGEDNGAHNRKLYEDIEAEILTIDPQVDLLSMQKSSDLLYELSKAVLHDRTIKQCFFESMSLIYFILQQLSIVHATNLRDYNRVSQLKYAMSLLTLLQSALFNSHTIDARLNLIDPSPFSFVGLIEIVCTDFRTTDAFMAENKYVKAKLKYEKRMIKKKLKMNRQSLRSRDRLHYTNTKRLSPTVRTREKNSDDMSNFSSPMNTARSMETIGTKYSDEYLSGKSSNDDNYYDDEENDFFDDNDDDDDDEYIHNETNKAERHRLLGPSLLLSNSHRRSPTKKHLWSHAPQTVDEAEENHLRSHGLIENIGHHVHASSSDESSEEDDQGGYVLEQEEYRDHEEVYHQVGGSKGLIQSIRHAYDVHSGYHGDRHEYDEVEDYHKTKKPITDGGIVLLKSSMDHKSLHHTAKRVASKEARLYGEEFHRAPMMEEAERKYQESLYETKMDDTETINGATARATRRKNRQAAQSDHKSFNSHKRHDDDHLSDHEDEKHTNIDEEHDLEIIAHHDFGIEHNKLLHDINIIQCMILVSIDSVTQHAGLHEHAGTLESLPMAVNNIPSFTSTRIVDYLKTFVHLVRGGVVSGGSLKSTKIKSKRQEKTETVNPTIRAWQMSNVMKVIHILTTGSHHLRRKVNTHASEEIQFYLCQRKFIDNIDPHVLYNRETLQMLWEVLWECLEARKTNDMTLLERLNYRSKVIMWNWRDVVADAEKRGEGVEMTTAELMMDKKKGTSDLSAHQQYYNSGNAGGTYYFVKLRRCTKHRKMFPHFYRGELLAPSADSISKHNKLIKKLLGEELSKTVVQNRKHNGIIQQRLFPASESDSSSSSSPSSPSSSSSSEDEEENRKSHEDKNIKWIKQYQSKGGGSNKSNQKDRSVGYETERQRSISYDDDGAETSSESDGDSNRINMMDSAAGRSSMISSSRPRRKRSVVARNLAGFGKALIGIH